MGTHDSIDKNNPAPRTDTELFTPEPNIKRSRLSQMFNPQGSWKEKIFATGEKVFTALFEDFHAASHRKADALLERIKTVPLFIKNSAKVGATAGGAALIILGSSATIYYYKGLLRDAKEHRQNVDVGLRILGTNKEAWQERQSVVRDILEKNNTAEIKNLIDTKISEGERKGLTQKQIRDVLRFYIWAFEQDLENDSYGPENAQNGYEILDYLKDKVRIMQEEAKPLSSGKISHQIELG